MMTHSIKNLREVEDSAVNHGHSDTMEARFPREDLDAEATGLGYLVLRPGKRQPFAHRHKNAEEIYVVLSGGGKLKLDDEVIELETMDAIRMAPNVARSLEAGPDGIEILAFGPRHADDVEMVPDFWES